MVRFLLYILYTYHIFGIDFGDKYVRFHGNGFYAGAIALGVCYKF